jgi:hypothetical protein
MSLQLLNDFILDIKVHSIQSTIPIGGGGSIPNNSILNIKLVDKTVDNTKIKDDTIINSLIADDAITTTKIIDNSITNSKLQGDSVTTAKILDNTITNSKLQGNNITNDKLFNKTIDNTKIADGTIISSLLATDITINGDLDVGGNLNVPTGSLTVNTANITSDLYTNAMTVTTEIFTNNLHSNEINVNGNLNMFGTGSISCDYITVNNIDMGNNLTVANEINTSYLMTKKLHLNNDDSYKTYGTESLSSGSVTVSTDAILPTSIVLLTRTSDPQATHAGFLAVVNIVSNVSFDVISSKNSDVGSFNWVIINPA